MKKIVNIELCNIVPFRDHPFKVKKDESFEELLESIKENAEIVNTKGIPQVPMLFFVSNGIGTGWNKEAWPKYQKDYLADVKNGSIVELDCPHYIHDYEYETISENIRAFLVNLKETVK